MDWTPTATAAFDHYTAPYLFPDAIQQLVTTEGGESAGTYYSYLAEPERAAALFGAEYQLPVPDSAALAPARQTILDGAAQTRIVIVNEAHHKPWHRVFTRSLLEELYAQGYRHFGLEALSFHPAFPNPIDTTGVPEFNMGYYVREPELADLIRTAKKMGYSVFGYEHMTNDPQPAREIGQARNIATYLADYPDDKLLLHVGYDHAREGRMPHDWGYAMAQRLKDTTGIDPLTVNQTTLVQTEGIDKVQAVYVDGTPFRPAADTLNYMDLYLTHPVYPRANGRPGWKVALDREPFRLNLTTSPATAPYLVAAYREGEDVTKTVPSDLVLIEETPRKEITLYLPEGNYQLVLRTPNGSAWEKWVTHTP